MRDLLLTLLYFVVGFLFAILNSWVVDAFEEKWEVAVFIAFWPLIVTSEILLVAVMLIWDRLTLP